MASAEDQEKWSKIEALLEEKLQFGFLEQTRSVVDVEFNGAQLLLVVSNEEAAEFFSAEVNQQRLLIVSRPVARIESIAVRKVEANPIN